MVDYFCTVVFVPLHKPIADRPSIRPVKTDVVVHPVAKPDNATPTTSAISGRNRAVKNVLLKTSTIPIVIGSKIANSVMSMFKCVGLL